MKFPGLSILTRQTLEQGQGKLKGCYLLWREVAILKGLDTTSHFHWPILQIYIDKINLDVFATVVYIKEVSHLISLWPRSTINFPKLHESIVSYFSSSPQAASFLQPYHFSLWTTCFSVSPTARKARNQQLRNLKPTEKLEDIDQLVADMGKNMTWSKARYLLLWPLGTNKTITQRNRPHSIISPFCQVEKKMEQGSSLSFVLAAHIW